MVQKLFNKIISVVAEENLSEVYIFGVCDASGEDEMEIVIQCDGRVRCVYGESICEKTVVVDMREWVTHAAIMRRCVSLWTPVQA